MKTIVPQVSLILLALAVVSCASKAPELPEDQELKVRQHRITPSEKLQDLDRARGGVPMPTAGDGSWKF